MIDSMSAMAFAKKLRARRAELKKRREVEVRQHRAAVVRWRLRLEAWIRDNARRIAIEANHERRRYGEVDSLSARGMPQPPKAPFSGDTIRKIDSILRRLAISGQKTVRLVPEEIDRLFGEDDEAS